MNVGSRGAISHFIVPRARDSLLLLSLLSLLAAILLPPITRNRPVHHYQLTFDISQSMNVQDVAVGGKTASRLELAKAATELLLQKLPCGSRIGWSVFTGQRTLPLITPMEICENYSGLRLSLDMINGKMRWFNGSSVGKGLHQSLRIADAIGDDVALIMFSDGHEAPPLRPGQTGLPKSEGLGLSGMLVGVGGDTPVQIPKSDAQGRNIGYWLPHEVSQSPGENGQQSHEELSRLKSEHMIQLAQLSGLEYVQIHSPAELNQTLINANLAKQAPSPVDYRWVPATLALLFLFLRYISFGRFWPRQKHHSQPVISSTGQS
ncbi:MAG: hypothetical protein KTR32_04240 [Granulosicoccus sp.]|nr:hypothetical protein [Granulosicoccus sp.]